MTRDLLRALSLSAAAVALLSDPRMSDEPGNYIRHVDTPRSPKLPPKPKKQKARQRQRKARRAQRKAMSS